jgi:hypothetical protein
MKFNKKLILELAIANQVGQLNSSVPFISVPFIYSQHGPDGFRSADGLRRFRMDQGSLDGLHAPKAGHVHFEIFENIFATKPQTINHVIVSN